MKVLHVTPSYFPAKSYGGPVASTHQLNLALAEKGIDVTVLTTDADGDSIVPQTGTTVEYSSNLRAIYCPRALGDDFSLSLLANLPSEIKVADVVHLTAVYSFTTIPTLFYASVFGKPVVWSPRGSLKHWARTTKSATKSAWEKICFAVAPRKTFIHCTSVQETDATTSRLSGALARQVQVIPNGVAVSEPRTHIQGQRLRLLFLGRLDPIKGIERLIDACKLLQSRSVAFALVIAGEGASQYVQSLKAQASSLGDAVRFTGFADDAKKQELFRSTDILILPSHSENFGMSVAEALAQGIPVVASKGTPWSGLESHQCGKWVENSADALANAIEQLSKEDLSAAGICGRQWMQQDFSWPRVADSMIELYSKALRA
jgi:glycosyltransferase involved in cell wall biosynthesis